MELKQIKELVRLLDSSKLDKLKIKNGDFSIHISRGAKIKTQVATQQQITETPIIQQQVKESLPKEPSSTTAGDTLNSPMVGTFYHAPSPKSPAFVKVGDKITKGDTIGVIEAMKIMNEIEAEFDCKIIEVLANNEQPVEFDMPLFKVERL